MLRSPTTTAGLLVCALLTACERPAVVAPQAADAADAEPAVQIAEESPVPVSLPATVTFNEHVQPILSEYCYHCHGPDAGTREPKEAPLRLDLPDDVFTLRDGSAAIVRGDPAASMIIQRMKDSDPGMIMPPPESHKTMAPHEIAIVERWIEQGAEYQAHWAFLPVERPAPPAVAEDWVKNPLDAFVAEKLAEVGLEPNPAESWPRFFRRLALDLTGLPPAPAELEAFVRAVEADPDRAVADAADRLMATPAHAEHMGRHWLDAARYGDTHGIHIDNYRAIWPYRDWVIRAFQQNMPWDEFTTEQIAGDLLPQPTLDQIVATGFNRCLSTTGEGGAIAEEYEAIYATDRVDTTAAIWLGLTASCAACHDHKFDPISMREFYALTAFFRNNTMRAMDGNNAEHPPTVFVPRLEDRPRWDALPGELAETRSQLARRGEDAGPEFNAWLAAAEQEFAGDDITDGLALHLPLHPGGPIQATVDGVERGFERELNEHNGGLLIHESPVELGDLLSFSRGEQVSYGGFVRVEGQPSGAIIARMDPANRFRGWDFFLVAGKPTAHVIDSWEGSANKVVGPKALEPGRWQHVMVTFDGTAPAAKALSIYLDGERQNATTKPNNVGGTIETAVPLTLGSRANGDSKLTGPVAFKDFRFYRRLLGDAEIASLAGSAAIAEILALPRDQRGDAQTAALRRHFVDHFDEPARDIRGRAAALEAEQAAIRARGSASLVFEEKKDGEPHAHILNRGDYADKGERVTADVPAILPPMPEGAPKNRLGLAMWLNDPANPLPARVTMNRTWYYFFGTGIVETNDDFGIMGARPSHPQLLDWLAAEFVSSGWDYRHMLKLMVTSASYRQSGHVTPEKLEADPANRLLSRGPRYRLDAEQIRDLALAASGLLSPTFGGPSVRPYQPEGVWEAVAMSDSNTRHYKPDEGEALYRRSLYTFWKRTAHHPTMEIFNAPSREQFCVRRDRTNTPLQALATLNDPQFVETSRHLAERAMAGAGSFDGRLDHATMHLLSRTFDAAERDVVRRTLDSALASFQADPEAAAAFIRTGASAPATDADPAELAAWTLICSKIFNLDETLNK
jgi:hypothetical protein